MQNLILFRTVRNSYGEVGSERQRKLKHEENLIHADKFTLDKLKFFLSKIHFQSRRRKGRDGKLNSLSNCHKLRTKI